MKTLFQWVTLFILTLTACAPKNTISSPETRNVSTQTEQPNSLLPSPSPTNLPSPPTTPVTVNRLIPLSICPSGNPELKPNFSQLLTEEFPQLGKPILEFLHSGGTPQAVINSLSWTEEQFLSPDPDWKSAKEYNEAHFFERDLTGDGIPELIVSEVNLYILGCRNEKYEILLELENDDFVNLSPAPWIIATEDLNSDNLPEIIVKSYFGRSGERVFRVFEWHSEEFVSLFIAESLSKDFSEPDIVEIPMGDILLIQDVDKNKTKEIIIHGYEFFTYGLPSRGEEYIFTWNGNNFILFSREYSKPIYRFEAVQDGDRYSLTGSYDKAITSYQDAIFNKELDWWSDERNRYEINCWGSKPNCSYFPTPPSPDPAEYYNLAAYSRFRIMLIYVMRGWLSDAETMYNEIQNQFPKEQPGSAYADMTSQFWNEYKQSKNMENACIKAIDYAKSNPTEILAYLGNGDYGLAYHGEQSLSYTAEDVCPFK